MVEVATPSKVCFPLIYVFFEVMLMSEIDGIRSCLEDYILLFLFDVCMHVCIYICMYACMYVCIYICINDFLETFHGVRSSCTEKFDGRVF